jgi:hypothetical protein
MNKWMSLFTSSDYRQVDSYTASLGFPILAPQVYRPHSILEPYLKLGAMQVQKTSSESAYTILCMKVTFAAQTTLQHLPKCDTNKNALSSRVLT